MKNSYMTIEFSANDSFEVKRSKFIGYVKPVKTQSEATDFIDEIKSKHWDAKHNVYAYVLQDGQVKRYSDDGEPQGTAGIPVLDVIEKSGVTDCCIVVTRYFGGILLGGGGLVRAYSHAASLALGAGNIIDMVLFNKCETCCDYTFYGRFPSLAAKYNGIICDTKFETDVKVEYMIPKELYDSFKLDLIDASLGKFDCQLNGEEYHKA